MKAVCLVSCTHLRSKKKSVCGCLPSSSFCMVWQSPQRVRDLLSRKRSSCSSRKNMSRKRPTSTSPHDRVSRRQITALTRPFPRGFNFQAQGLLDVQSTWNSGVIWVIPWITSTGFLKEIQVDRPLFPSCSRVSLNLRKFCKSLTQLATMNSPLRCLSM
jgi:hypothetical protein